MPIPDYQTIMLPLLRHAADGKEHSLQETVEKLAQDFKLTDDERRELLPSGKQAIFDNRVGWARTYLKNARLLEYTRRGHYEITDRGRETLGENPPTINARFLRQFSEFREFQTRGKDINEGPDPRTPEHNETPEESLETSFQRLRAGLAQELLDQILANPPSLFEKLVVELLVKMGYGGTLKDAGQAIGKSGDEGIDGIIKEDRLGLETIYVQAKRWKPENTVSRPEIQRFAGALQGQRAKKGVFITTSTFSKEAREYASNIDTKIVLIDGETLTDLMIDYNIAVTPVQTFELKRLDSDYFTDE